MKIVSFITFGLIALLALLIASCASSELHAKSAISGLQPAARQRRYSNRL